jgi:hypothetical protein
MSGKRSPASCQILDKIKISQHRKLGRKTALKKTGIESPRPGALEFSPCYGGHTIGCQSIAAADGMEAVNDRFEQASAEFFQPISAGPTRSSNVR